MNDREFRQQRRHELASDQINGASPLARRALDSLAEYAGVCQAQDVDTLRTELQTFAEELQYTRPNMAPVFNLIQRWVDQIDGLKTTDTATLRRDAAEIAQTLSDVSIRAVQDVAEAAARHVGKNSVVITHSLSSTVQASFAALARRGDVRAIVTESRPGLEGRNQARHLDQLGVPVTFITDAQMGVFIQEATVALVGADTVLADGTVVNKAGTCLLALAAHDRGIPVYVCCESFKRSDFRPESFELHEMDAREINVPQGKYITARNIYFDMTPARLIDAWITEEGVATTPP